MAPSDTPPLPHVDYLNRELATGNTVTFISTVSGNPRLFTGRIVFIHGGQLCIESGALYTVRGHGAKATQKKPDRVWYENICLFPSTNELAETERLAADWERKYFEMVEKHTAAATTLNRIRKLAERWKYTGDRKEGPLRELLTALGEEQR